MTEMADTSPDIQDISGEVSPNVPESDKVKFKNVLKCNTLGYIRPKNKDDEYYQLCHIDDSGKMQGVSTPFQFLEQSADLVQDDAININMIHKEKEMASTGTDGSQATQQIDTEEEEEVQKRAMKPIFHQKYKELKHEVEGLQLRMQMGDDDDDDKKVSMSSSTDSSTSSKEVDKDLSNLSITESGEGNSQDSQVASEQTSEGAQATTVAGSDLSAQAIQAPTNQATQGSQVEGTDEDLEEMHEAICSLSKVFEGREEEVDRLKRVIKAKEMEYDSLMRDCDRQTKELNEKREKLQQQSHQGSEAQALHEEQISDLEGRIADMELKRRERTRKWAAKSRTLKLDIKRLLERNESIRNKYTKMENKYESLMAFHRWAAFLEENRRCKALTLQGLRCKRNATTFIGNLHVCRQHRI